MLPVKMQRVVKCAALPNQPSRNTAFNSREFHTWHILNPFPQKNKQLQQIHIFTGTDAFTLLYLLFFSPEATLP